MKFHAYAIYDKDLKCFTEPKFDINDEKNTLVLLARSIRGKQFDPRGKVAYKVAVYDDETGLIEKDFKQLCDCEELVPPQEVKQDEGNQ